MVAFFFGSVGFYTTIYKSCRGIPRYQKRNSSQYSIIFVWEFKLSGSKIKIGLFETYSQTERKKNRTSLQVDAAAAREKHNASSLEQLKDTCHPVNLPQIIYNNILYLPFSPFHRRFTGQYHYSHTDN